MLGCAYRDMGEAPAAIHYYTIATEKADTAHADSATYATLFRVYGQMAMIYEQQNMPEGELTALSDFCRYAQLARDTTKGHSFIIDAYKRQATETTYIYRWVTELPLDPTGGNGLVPITPTRPDSIVIAYSNIHLSQIQMNWGWGYSFESETWYTPTGDWIANDHNYNRDRHIIHNFTKKQL